MKFLTGISINGDTQIFVTRRRPAMWSTWYNTKWHSSCSTLTSHKSIISAKLRYLFNMVFCMASICRDFYLLAMTILYLCHCRFHVDDEPREIKLTRALFFYMPEIILLCLKAFSSQKSKCALYYCWRLYFKLFRESFNTWRCLTTPFHHYIQLLDWYFYYSGSAFHLIDCRQCSSDWERLMMRDCRNLFVTISIITINDIFVLFVL